MNQLPVHSANYKGIRLAAQSDFYLCLIIIAWLANGSFLTAAKIMDKNLALDR
jgi:hypothetical protein